MAEPFDLPHAGPKVDSAALSGMIDQAERLWWQGDLSEAVTLLDRARHAPDFWPKGALILAYVLRQRGEGSEAQALASQVVQLFPHDLAAWELLIFAVLHGSSLPALNPQFIAALRGHDQITREGIRLPALLSLIRFAPADWRGITAVLCAGQVLTKADMDVLTSCIGFLHAVQAARARAPGRVTWSFAILGSARACTIAEGHCRLDLSWFRPAQIAQGWTPQILRQLALALAAELGAQSYRDDAGFTSGPDIDAADLSATLIHILLVSTMLELTGADPDVRCAHRQMRLDPGTLLVRAGRVELWALTTWAQDRPAALQAATDAAQQADTPFLQDQGLEGGAFWWPRLDPKANAIHLWTNAGWYGDPETAAASFDDWANRYLAAMYSADLLVECAEDFARLATLYPPLRNRPLHDWDTSRFLQMLDGKQVVFATPYATEIGAHWDSGALQSLWRDAGHSVQLASLKTVQAPMSVWPFRPDRNWSASFARLQTQCARAIEQTGADVFLASCGCYGLPIVHAMHQGFRGLTAVYNGHMMNGLFGILTNDLRGHDLHASAPTSPHWRPVNLDHRFPGIARIDDGRYVLDDPSPHDL